METLTWAHKIDIDNNEIIKSNKNIAYRSAKILGGESSLGDMTYFRGHPNEYDRWLFPDWRYSEIKDYFLKSENNFGLKTASNDFKKIHHGSNGLLTVSHFSYKSDLVNDITDAIKRSDTVQSNDLNGDVNIGFTLLQSIQRYKIIN